MKVVIVPVELSCVDSILELETTYGLLIARKLKTETLENTLARIRMWAINTSNHASTFACVYVHTCIYFEAKSKNVVLKNDPTAILSIFPEKFLELVKE